MKKCLEILDFEGKETKAGKPFVRYKTSEGWMSCFDAKSNEELKKQKGNSVDVDVIESGEFKNIKRFIGEGSATENETEKPKELTKEFPKSMKVAYAKDVFCQLVGRISQKEFDEKIENNELLKLMEVAIEVINKAEKAF
jgi:hypothetical protein